MSDEPEAEVDEPKVEGEEPKAEAEEPTYEDLINQLIPPQGFIKDLLQFSRQVTDASDRLIIPVALALAGHALGRNVYDPNGPLHLNLYQILVGSSGCGKSTAIRIGVNVLQNTMSETILPDEFTAEKMVDILTEHPKSIWVCSEFSLALEHMGRDYEKGLRPMLTHFYDCPEVYRRFILRKTYTVNNPFLSLLLGSQADWWISKLTDIDAVGGWLPRVAICAAGPKMRFYPHPMEYDPSKFSELCRTFEALAGIEGKVEYSHAAEEALAEWQKIHFEILKEQSNPDLLSPFFIRNFEYFRKVAAIYAVTRQCALTVEQEDVDAAYHWMASIREATITFVEGLAFNHDEKDILRVLRLIRGNPGITHSDLSNRAHVGFKWRLERILETLEERNQIVKKEEVGLGKRPLRTYGPLEEDPQEAVLPEAAIEN